MPEMRIQKFLSRAGVASRREAESWMAEGRVRVNGRVVTEMGAKVDPDQDRIEVDGRVVERSPIRWLLLNKPRGYLCTRDDPHGRDTVYHLLPDEAGELSYVGRLDQDTEGLLLLSNDGDVIHRLLHPSYEVEREYRIVVEGHVGPDALDRLRAGIPLEDGTARAGRAEVVEEKGHGSVVSLVIREGRKREVRRMMEAVGHPVTHLRRVRFGPLALGDLPLGEWRELTDEEVGGLRARVADGPS